VPHLLIVGGSDAGIMAGLRARELDPTLDVTLVVADEFPNFSICGIPYYVSGEVIDWHNLAHRTRADLENAGLHLLLNHRAESIDPAGKRLAVTGPDGRTQSVDYDRLVIGTGAVPIRPPITGLDALGPADGVHLLHSMGDTFALVDTLQTRQPESAVIVGAGYIGLEMAESLTNRGLAVTVVEQLPFPLPTVDPELGALIGDELRNHGVTVHTDTTVTEISRDNGALAVHTADGRTIDAGLVLVSVGVRPDTTLAASAGVPIGIRGALVVDDHMRTNLPDVYAAGDCVHTHHRLYPEPTYLPLGSTAHKQGRTAGENAAGGDVAFAGSLGTQAVRVFDLVAARTGLRDHDAVAAGYSPVTVGSIADDHKAYYPGATTIHTRVTGDTTTGRLLGVQLVGAVPTAVAKRIDTSAAALYSGLQVDDIDKLDLSYTPPLGSPWDTLHVAAQTWTKSVEVNRQATVV
jgi:NADPH-dependent 2,4-dienoyl-CoA reductase/sulfur reductase-like enzyme